MISFGGASLAAVIRWCHAMRHGLAAGLDLPKMLRQQAKSGPPQLREVAARVGNRVEGGVSLEDSLEAERRYFPTMFIDMVAIGERTGHLPEIFGGLERYFHAQLSMRQKFFREITWPVFQLFAAIGVIALLIWVMGMIAESNGGKADPLGIGLSGASGAMIFLGIVAGVMGGMVAGYLFITRGLRQRSRVEQFLLKTPAIGPTLDALAMQRFCLGMELTLESGISVDYALERSLNATGNAAFTQNMKPMLRDIRAGKTLWQTLARHGAFTDSFLDIVHVAEESGRIPEVMAAQSAYYQEEAERRMTTLTKLASFGVWAFVAILITVAIFRIFTGYIAAITSMT